MRRKDKEVTDRAAMESVIRRCTVCRLALCDEGKPYVVPLCFGYDGKRLYFHSASEGTKLDILRRNSNVCFEFDTDVEVKPGQQACAWGMKYRSVVGFGKVSFLQSREEKARALDLIVGAYGDGGAYSYPEKTVDSIEVYALAIESMTLKVSGYNG
jgi:nitroimidazol reductase NimA-like FMN-containing flavoprotein (pyridoxamine 5'-phosphate oxidase superfamily)